MSGAGYADAVGAHYTTDQLGEKILAGLRAAGKDTDALRTEDLETVDHLHAGGVAATRALLGRARLQPELRVLDVGGGLGGPARLIAHEVGCSVTVLDLSEAFCRAGEMLTARVGLADRVTFRHGSALAMPFPDGSFDRVWTQHATMNIAEKSQLFAEIHRVLRPGGLLAMQEMLAGPNQPIHFPVPWAADASINFLQSPDELRSLLAELGFRDTEWVDAGATAPSGPAPGGPALAAQLTLGPQLAEMAQNVGRNVGAGRLALVQAVFARP